MSKRVKKNFLNILIFFFKNTLLFYNVLDSSAMKFKNERYTINNFFLVPKKCPSNSISKKLQNYKHTQKIFLLIQEFCREFWSFSDEFYKKTPVTFFDTLKIETLNISNWPEGMPCFRGCLTLDFNFCSAFSWNALHSVLAWLSQRVNSN